MLFVGKGQTQFLEGLGNFHIKNYIQQKVPLSTYHVNHQGSGDVITMEGGGYSVKTCVHCFVRGERGGYLFK